MKKHISILIFVMLLLAQTLLAQEGVLAPAEYQKNIETLKPQLLDVRTAREYQGSHLKNALLADWTNPQQFADRTQYLDKSKPVFVYCASGARSAEAAKWLMSKGFTNVQNLKGGIIAWKTEGLPVEAAENKSQLTVDQYKVLAKSADIVLIDFGAEWCPPCKKMEPVLKTLKEEAGDKITIIKVDGGNDIEVMKSMRVTDLPVFIVYKKGKEAWRKQGVIALEELRSKLLD